MSKTFEKDTQSLIKNPGMGWVIYVDAFEDGFPVAQEFWDAMNEPSRYASILYIRVPWSQLEPECGSYAWLCDGNYKSLIEGAKKRQLKLAFRVYVDSRHSYRQATPEYVKQAGCSGYMEYDYWNPYIYDEVFKQKFEAFIIAFASEYDSADTVEFIDAEGVGYWGETHHVRVEREEQYDEIYRWLANTYSSNFRNVLLGCQYQDESFDFYLRDWAIAEKGYLMRRDSLGSPVWFKEYHKKPIRDNFVNAPLFAENCYHHIVSRANWWQGDGFKTVRDMLLSTLNDALDVHANTLDLRVCEDANCWVNEHLDLVKKFIQNCGYRFCLTNAEYISEQRVIINHIWENIGVGKIPNDRKNWGGKYKVAFTLFDGKKMAYEYIDSIIDISKWVKGEQYQYTTVIENAPKGNYKLYVGIKNTKENTPNIHLAIKDTANYNGWYEIGDINI